MTGPEFVAYLERYARSFAAPVYDRTTVIEVRQAAGGYLVATDRGDWRASNVVIATGYYAGATRPPSAGRLAPELAQVTPTGYRNPAGLPDGGVLVVGASASGIQLANELSLAGREVVLAVGRHTRLPRRYRGHDILWWLDRIGSLDRSVDEMPAGHPAWREPSMQLVGGADRLDLGILQDRGVRLTGRLGDVAGRSVHFEDDLAANVTDADERLGRLLARLDRYAEGAGAAGRLPGPEVPPQVRPARPPRRLDLRRAGISTVVWATGHRPWYPWLRVPVLDRTGRIRHRRGVTAAPGLYAIGLRFQHRRSATFIDGARHDAAYLTDHICSRRHPDRMNGARHARPVRL
jgi:putative flavoprotein involved in K+ transport